MARPSSDPSSDEASPRRGAREVPMPPEGGPFSVHTSEDRLAWIFGSSRSGSTWLLRMLSSLDAVVPVDDPHLGHHLGVWRPISLAWATAEHPPDLTTLDRVKHDKDSYFFSDRYRDAWEPALRRLIVDRFDAEVADTRDALGAGEPVVVVKEPGSHVADVLMGLFPASRMIFLLRDGRDVVDSWLAAYREGSWAQEEGAFPLAPHGREAFIRWQASVWAYRVRSVAAAYRDHDPSRRTMVRYEDLVAEPVDSLRRICDAAGLKSDERELERIAAAHDIEA